MSASVRERVGDDLIHRLRQKVCEAVAQMPPDEYDAQDLEVNIKSSDTLILMFAGQYMDDHGIKSLNNEEIVEEKVIERIKNLATDAIKWRKQHDLISLTLDDFSSEFFDRGFYRVGVSGPTGDKVTIVMDFGKHKKISSSVNKMEMAYFFVFTERITKEHFRADRDVTVIFDHTNYGLANMDATFMIEFFSLISSYYPTIISRTFAYELPWYLKPVVTMAQAVLPSRITKNFAVVDRNSIKQKLDKEQIPVWMGGECECNLLDVSATKELHEVATRYGVTDTDLQKLKDYYSKTP